MKDFEKIDKELIELLQKRQKLALDKGVSTTWSKDYLADLAGGSLTEAFLSSVYREIDSANLSAQKEVCVAFLGTNGSFTHQAAISRFGHSVKYLPQEDIGTVFRRVENGEADYGVVPVENSTEGAVNRTLDTLINTETKIVGEVRLRIHHNFLSNVPRSEIKNIYSHPQALAQCHGWLKAHFPNAQLIESESTTEGAMIASKSTDSAAVASLLAAEDLSLNVLEKNIEDLKGNSTRFMVISNRVENPTGNDKTSLLLCTKDQAGALYKALAPFTKYGVSLTMIESRPSKRRSWEYFFFIDFLGHINDGENIKMIEELGEMCQFVKNLGSYPRATD